jgi:hypothetical protein
VTMCYKLATLLGCKEVHSDDTIASCRYLALQIGAHHSVIPCLHVTFLEASFESQDNLLKHFV